MNTTRSKKAGQKNHGFTLVELMVTLAVVGILAAVAAPDVSQWIQNYRARTAARQLMSDLQSARIKAVSERVQFRVSVDAGNNQYQVQKGNDPEATTSWTNVGNARVMTDGVVISANSAPAILRILFTPLGYAGFSATQADGTARATVTQGGATYAVVVTPTGGIRISERPNRAL
jgi:prepilin-type N-terminal cleavage/methylation domain-containing protein